MAEADTSKTEVFTPIIVHHPDFPIYDFVNSRIISVGTLCRTVEGVGIVVERDIGSCGSTAWADLCHSFNMETPKKCLSCGLNICQVRDHYKETP